MKNLPDIMKMKKIFITEFDIRFLVLDKDF